MKRQRSLTLQALYSSHLKSQGLIFIQSYSLPQHSITHFHSLSQHMASTDLCKEAVVSSFTDTCLPSTWFPCSSAITAADNFLCVRHSLQGKISMQTPRTPLLLGYPVAPTSGAHSSRGPGQNMRAGREGRGSSVLPGAWKCVLLLISTSWKVTG